MKHCHHCASVQIHTGLLQCNNTDLQDKKGIKYWQYIMSKRSEEMWWIKSNVSGEIDQDMKVIILQKHSSEKMIWFTKRVIHQLKLILRNPIGLL